MANFTRAAIGWLLFGAGLYWVLTSGVLSHVERLLIAARSSPESPDFAGVDITPGRKGAGWKGELPRSTEVRGPAGVSPAFHFELEVVDPLEDDYDPETVVVGDVTGDRRPDIVMSLFNLGLTHDVYPYVVRIYEQTPSGALKSPVEVGLRFSSFVKAVGIELADLDRDGVKEIVVGHDEGLTVIENSAPGFVVAGEYVGSAEGTFLAPVDADGDGLLDIFAQGWNYGADIFFGNGRGGISRVEHLETPYSAYATVEASDFSADGHDDVLVQSGNVVRVHKGGEGIRSPLSLDLAPFLPYGAEGMTVADMNRDGKPDLVITDNGDRGIPLPAGVKVLYRGSDNAFSHSSFILTTGMDPTDPSGTNTPAAVRVADIDGNGYPDVVTMFSSWRKMGYILQGPAGFDRLVTMQTQPNPWVNNHYLDNSFAIADVNSDGCLDIVLAELSSSLRVFYGRGCQPRIMRTGGPLMPRRR